MQQNNSYQEPRSGPAFWLCFGVTALSALISLGYALAALSVTGTSDAYALYAASRSGALAVAVLSVGGWRRPGVLFTLALTMAAVQALDALIGLGLHDAVKTVGPAALALIGAGTALAFVRRPPALRH